MIGLPGTSLEQSMAVGKTVQERLLRVSGVVSVAQRAGRAELADEVSGPESSEFDVTLKTGAAVAGAVDRMRKSLEGVPGFIFGVSQFFRERLEEVTGGEPAPVAVSISGSDLDRLHELGGAVERIMSSIPGARDVRADNQAEAPQVLIKFDRQKAASLGATLGEIQAAVTTAFGGLKVADVFEGERIVPVVVKFPDQSRSDLDSIRSLPIRTASGVVPLRTVADVSIRAAPNLINRQGGSRRAVVTCDTSGSVSRFSRELRRRLRSLPLPTGYAISLSGDYEASQQSLRELIFAGALALAGVFLLLFSDFRSLRPALLVFVNLPFALVGGVAAAVLSRTSLSLGALVGFVTLCGISARNAIMLLSVSYTHLRA